MESKFEPPKEGENVIDSVDEVERVRWLVTRYLVRPPVFIRAPYAEFDDLMCDPEGWVWGIVLSREPANPGVQVVRCTEYLISPDNVVIDQPIRLTS